MTPRQRNLMPSVRMSVDMASDVLLYRGTRVPLGALCNACRRILITSTALTTVTASVIPAARPAVIDIQILASNAACVKVEIAKETYREKFHFAIFSWYPCP